ncbi:MlaD family protein [Patulibacter defluvii]|uniref:MlaD family protein n=1 Tax=Patulibacter defluvii TaxID=3095358 RepID=UPI002A754423|nr:MlaD family protein [Patulibacter sp. DM4]
MRVRRSSLAASPVLIGAATLLVAIVAVVLAYNANTGLPFVRTYDVQVELRDGQRMTPGNDVRLGGARIGMVTAVEPEVRRDGRLVAVASLQLDRAAEPLPADTTVLIRPRSALGLKYVELRRGRSPRTLPAGGRLRVEQAVEEPVDLDQLASVYDAPTRAAFQRGIVAFGSGLAGRGRDLNRLVAVLPEAFERLSPAMANLADPASELAATLRALARTAGEVAPVAETQSSLLRHMDATFSALAAVARPHFQELLRTGVATQRSLQRELPVARPFLRRSGRLMARLEPGIAALERAAPVLSAAFDRGVGTNRRLPRLLAPLDDTVAAVQRTADDPLVSRGLAAADRLVDRARPLVDALGPTQVRCNYIALFGRNASSVIAEGNQWGTWQRAGLILTPIWMAPRADPGPQLHHNGLPHTGQPGSGGDCEAGNEGYRPGQMIGNVPGIQRTDSRPMITGGAK